MLEACACGMKFEFDFEHSSVNSYLQPFQELKDKRQWLRKEASISATHADYRPCHGLVSARVAASAAALVESGGGSFSPAFYQVFRASELPAAEEVDEEADERQEECT
jgi:hypothetical protein